MEDGRSLFDLFHSEWTLLALGPIETCIDEFTAAAEAMTMDLRVLRLPQAALLELYEAPLVLIRPDQIVAWRGHTDIGAESVLFQVMGWASAEK
jgi:hypothetical protein